MRNIAVFVKILKMVYIQNKFAKNRTEIPFPICYVTET